MPVFVAKIAPAMAAGPWCLLQSARQAGGAASLKGHLQAAGSRLQRMGLYRRAIRGYARQRRQDLVGAAPAPECPRSSSVDGILGVSEPQRDLGASLGRYLKSPVTGSPPCRTTHTGLAPSATRHSRLWLVRRGLKREPTRRRRKPQGHTLLPAPARTCHGRRAMIDPTPPKRVRRTTLLRKAQQGGDTLKVIGKNRSHR